MKHAASRSVLIDTVNDLCANCRRKKSISHMRISEETLLYMTLVQPDCDCISIVIVFVILL